MSTSIIPKHCPNNPIQDISTKEAILSVTLDLINQEGFEAVTIRKISARAGVNVALINYHFGTKEKLLNLAVKILLDQIKDCFLILDNYALAPEVRLTNFLIEYAQAFRNNPELLKRILAIGSITFESQLEYISFMKTMGINKVLNTIKELTGEEESEELVLFTVQLVGAIALPALLAPTIEQYAGNELQLPDTSTQVIKLMNRFFKKSDYDPEFKLKKE